MQQGTAKKRRLNIFDILELAKEFSEKTELSHLPPKLMVEALSTRGFVSGSKSFTEDLRDQRHLAHLGDAVLECVVRFHLHNMHHDWPLSVITSANQKLITAKALHEVAVYLELPKYLLHRQADQASERVLAETVEALIGAVFFNDGFDAASAFTMRILQDSGTWEVAVNPPEN